MKWKIPVPNGSDMGLLGFCAIENRRDIVLTKPLDLCNCGTSGSKPLGEGT